MKVSARPAASGPCRIEDLARVHDELFVGCAERASALTNEVIEEMSRAFDRLEFSFSMPASRNPYQSHLPGQLAQVLFMDALWKTKAISVVVTSPALACVLRQRAPASVKIYLRPGSRLKMWMRWGARFFKTSAKMARIFWRARSISESHRVLQTPQTLLIKTFLLNQSFVGTEFRDRYFGDFFFRLRQGAWQPVMVPCLLAVKDWSALARSVATADVSIFCKEAVLGFSGYLRAWWASLRGGFLSIPPSLKENPYAPLVGEELRWGGMTDIIFEAHSTYLFTEWLSRQDLQVAGLIDWNENHLYDRALWKGARDFHLRSPMKAYQGVVLDSVHDLYLEPIPYELAAGLYPKQLAVPGTGWIRDRHLSEFPIQVSTWPLFRMSGVLTGDPPTDSFVLVALPLVEPQAREILAMAETLARGFPDLQFRLRAHPLLPLTPSSSMDNFKADTNTSANQSLRQCSVLISAASSICFEARLLGVDCLLFRAAGTPRQNPIPPGLRGEGVREVRNAAEAQEFLRHRRPREATTARAVEEYLGFGKPFATERLFD